MSIVAQFTQTLQKKYTENDVSTIQRRLRSVKQLWQSCLALPELFDIFLQTQPAAADWKPGWLGLAALGHYCPSLKGDVLQKLQKSRVGQTLLTEVYTALMQNERLPSLPSDPILLPDVVNQYLNASLAAIALQKVWQSEKNWAQVLNRVASEPNRWLTPLVCLSSWLTVADIRLLAQQLVNYCAAESAAQLSCAIIIPNVADEMVADLLEQACQSAKSPEFAHSCQNLLEQVGKVGLGQTLVAKTYEHLVTTATQQSGHSSIKTLSAPTVQHKLTTQLSQQLEQFQQLSAEVARQLGDVYAHQGELLAAHSAYELSFQLRPNAKVLPELFKVKLAMGHTIGAQAIITEMPAELSEKTLAQAQLAIKRGDLTSATELAQAAVQQHQLPPAQLSAWALILEQAMQADPTLGQTVVQLYQTFTRQQPANPEFIEKYAKTLLKNKQYLAAQNAALEWQSLQPQEVETYIVLAQALAQQPEPAKRQEEFKNWQKAWQLRPNDTAIALQLAQTAFEIGEYDTSRTVCQKILHIQKTSKTSNAKHSLTQAQAHLLLGKILKNDSTVSDVQVLSHYQQASLLAPQLPIPWQAIALHYKAHGNLTRAVSILESNQYLIDLHYPEADRFFDTLGALYRERGEFTQAVTAYQQASQLAPHNAGHQQQLGELYKAGGWISKAIEAYQNALQIQPDSVPVCLALGELLESNNEPKKAFEAFYNAYQYNQAQHKICSAEHLIEIGRLGGLINEQANIYPILANAVQAYPDRFELFVFFGKTAEKLGQYETAIQAYSNAYQLTDQKQTDLLVRQASCQMALYKPQSVIGLLADLTKKDAEIYQLLGQAYSQADLWREAAAALHEACYLMPNDQVLLHEAAQACKKAGLIEQAINSYNELISLAPSNPNYYTEQGVLYFETGKTILAHRAFEKAKTLSPNNPNVLIPLGRCLRQDHNIEAAILIYEEAITTRAQHPLLWEELGDLYAEIGKNAHALTAYQNAIDFAANPVTGSLTTKKDNMPDQRRARCLRKAVECATTTQDSSLIVSLLQDLIKIDPSDTTSLYELGLLQARQGKFRPALNSFRRVLEINPNSVQAAVSAAQAAQHIGDWQRAEDFLQQALQFRTTAADLWMQLGKVQLHRQSYEAAMVSLQKALALEPNAPETILYLAQINLQLKSYANAEKYALQLKHTNTLTNIPDLLLLGEILLDVQQYAAALTLYQSCVAQATPELKQQAWLGLLMATICNGEYAQLASELQQHPTPNGRYQSPSIAEARQILHQAINADAQSNGTTDLNWQAWKHRWLHLWGENPSSITSLQHIAQKSLDAGLWVRIAQLERQAKHYTAAQQALQQAEKLDASSPILQLEQALLALQTHNLPLAQKAVQAAQANQPQWELPIALQSKLYAAQADWETAISHLNRALQLDPQQIDWQAQLARLHQERQDLGAALAAQQRAIELATLASVAATPFAKLYATLAELEALDDDSESALAHYLQALQLLPGIPNWETAVGQLHLKLNQNQQALESFKKARQRLPQALEPVLGEAQALFNLKQFAETTRLTQQAAVTNPHNVQVFWLLGKSLWAQQQLPAALEHYQRAARLQPNIAAIWQEMAQILVALKQPSAALATAQKALAISPNSSTLWLMLGDIASQLPDWQEACSAYRQALQLQPNSNTTLKLAQALYQSGQLDQALAQLQQALQFAPLSTAQKAEIYQHCAVIYKARRDSLRSAQSYQKAAELLENNPNLWQLAGKYYLEAEQTAVAQDCLAAALKLAPQNADIRRDFEIASSRHLLEPLV
jgi:tetratricopeptide (TPR) repeat protein